MDFAKKHLEKYGWTPGKGLGRYEDGIREALKPQLKRSTAGVGHDAAKDFTDHWWNKLYDKASGNIQVETTKHGKTKKITVKDPDAVELTNKTWSVKKRKKENGDSVAENDGYMEHFVRKAILTSGGAVTKRLETDESESSDDDDDKKVGTDGKKTIFQMTDEELFAACGGRTAHKGARHGLRATGKLARVEEQEALLLKDPRFNGYSHKTKIDDTNDTDREKNKRKKRKNKDIMENTEEEEDINKDIPGQNRIQLDVVSDKKKKHKSNENDKNHQTDCEQTSKNNEKSSKKKKKIKENEVEENFYGENEICNSKVFNDDVIEQKSKEKTKKKERKMGKEVEGSGIEEVHVNCEIQAEVSIKIKKSNNIENDQEAFENGEIDINPIVKKKKKKNK